MSSQASSRHDRRRQETRRRILEASVDLFAEQGYEATKVSEICEGADVARQTFFNHFPAKRDLLVDLFEIGVDLLSANLDSACQRADTTRERLALLFADIVEPAVAVGPFNRDLVAHVIHADASSELEQNVRRIFLRLVERGLEAGDVTRRYEPEVLAELLEGAVLALMRDWSARGGFDPARRAAQMADVIADALEKRPEEP